MVRNKMRIRLKSEDFSPTIAQYVRSHENTMRSFLSCERMVVILALIIHNQSIPLTYDNILFIVNRIEINDAELQSLEDSATAAVIDSWLES